LSFENSGFPHGQLPVACSRVGKRQELLVYANSGETKNVFHEFLLQ